MHTHKYIRNHTINDYTYICYIMKWPDKKCSRKNKHSDFNIVFFSVQNLPRCRTRDVDNNCARPAQPAHPRQLAPFQDAFGRCLRRRKWQVARIKLIIMIYYDQSILFVHQNLLPNTNQLITWNKPAFKVVSTAGLPESGVAWIVSNGPVPYDGNGRFNPCPFLGWPPTNHHNDNIPSNEGETLKWFN